MEAYEKLLTQLNAEIWDFSELKFCEYRSSGAIIDLLKKEGFSVKSGLAGMDTAFTASFGSGHPIIGILAEYDALSGLSQKANVASPSPREETPNGHGCGHSLLGSGSVGAALMVRDYLKESKRSGTVQKKAAPEKLILPEPVHLIV